MKYGELSLGQVEAVVNKLGGMDGVRRFLSGQMVLQAVARTLSTIKTFDPVAFVGKGWKVHKNETDKMAANLTEVDFSKMVLETCLKEGETSITGEEKLKRLKEGSNARLGAKAFLALLEEKDQTTLEWLYKEKGVTWLNFFGDILESPFGNRYVLCLYRRSGGRWGWYYRWLGETTGIPGTSRLLSQASSTLT